MNKRTRSILLTATIALVGLPALGVSWMAWSIAHPAAEVLTLPDSLIASTSKAGAALPASREAAADLSTLAAALQTQETRSGCGPASAATVLSALRGSRVSQDDVYSPEARALRSRLRTFFTGIPLDALGAMIRADGAQATVTHAGDSTAQAFRDAVRRNESTSGDYLVINFFRSALGQDGGGHFSPVGAYDAASDRLLILDVATFRYPPVWAPLPDVFAAMNTLDPESHTTRGWIEVSDSREGSPNSWSSSVRRDGGQ